MKNKGKKDKIKQENLEKLHGLLTDIFISRLEIAKGSDGFIDPKMLKEIREFLKDNNISIEEDNIDTDNLSKVQNILEGISVEDYK